MKKNLLIMGLSVLAFSSTIFGGTIPKINVNGHKVLIQNSPFIEADRTYIPLRNIAESLGAKVEWESKTSTAIIKQGNTIIRQAIGENVADVNGKKVILDAKAQLKDGVTYVPVRFISEALGGEVKYEPKKNVVDIKIEKDPNLKYDKFGKIIRTTDLPKNAKEFPYILEGIPNEMYEMKMYYQNIEWLIKPVDGKDYIRPVNMATQNSIYSIANAMIWKQRTEKNLDTRLNVDYRTVNEKWVEDLLSTYEPLEYERYKPRVQQYVKYLKDNHISIEGDYYVEPSMMYDSTTVRVWVKFRMTSDKAKTGLFYNGLEEYAFKTNVWYEGYTDLNLSTRNGWSDGSDYYFQRNELINPMGNYSCSSTIKEIK